MRECRPTAARRSLRGEAVAEGALATLLLDASRLLPGGLFSGAGNPVAHLVSLPIAAM
jgi:hypothetical protein